MTIATGILIMMAMTIGTTLIGALVYSFLARGRNWRQEFFSIRVLPFVFIGLAIVISTFAIGIVEKRSADEALRLSVSDIEADCDDQLSLLLHSDAGAIVDACMGETIPSQPELLRLSNILGLDELSIVDASGLVIASTDPGVTIGQQFFTDECRQRPYRSLLQGRRPTISQRFRVSTTSDRLMKYFAMSLPNGGFLQVGYTWETFEREFPRYFLPNFEHRKVGESGFCVVLDARRKIEVEVLGHPEALGKSAEAIGLTAAQAATPANRIFGARLFGIRCRCMFYADDIANRRILAAMPIAEFQNEAIALALSIALMLMSVYVGFRLIVRKIRLQQEKIDALRAAEERHRSADLALASSIQRAELRTDGTDGEGYRLASLMHAAREVGGDFYDYYELDDGRLVLVIADVSGKGIPAAFFMMKARMTIKSRVSSSDSVAEAVAGANRELARNNPAEMFVTAWVGVYDRKTGKLDYVSAGHNPPLVRRAGGAVEWLAAPRGAAIGVFETAGYRSAQLELAPGDRLFLYTDGVTEAMNGAGELFGNERLKSVLDSAAGPLVPEVLSVVRTFVAGAEQSDDITMLEMEVKS